MGTLNCGDWRLEAVVPLVYCLDARLVMTFLPHAPELSRSAARMGTLNRGD